MSKRRRLAGYLALAGGLSIVLTIGAKVGFLLARSGRLRNPSSRIAIATTVYGCCAMMLAGAGDGLCTGRVRVTALFLLAGPVLPCSCTMFPRSSSNTGRAFLRLPAHFSYQFDVGQLAALLLLLAVTRFARLDAEEMIAYGARMATLSSNAPVEQSAFFPAWRYRIEHVVPQAPERFQTLSNDGIAIVCGGRNG